MAKGKKDDRNHDSKKGIEMKITKQNFEIVYGHDIEMQGCKISCVPDNNLKEKVLCGEYSDVYKTAKVFAEMAYVGWMSKNSVYIMPQNEDVDSKCQK